jgi:hypothetical protein
MHGAGMLPFLTTSQREALKLLAKAADGYTVPFMQRGIIQNEAAASKRAVPEAALPCRRCTKEGIRVA